MRNGQKKQSSSELGLVTGLFSKSEAAQLIIGGARNLHSTLLGSHDPCVQVTKKLMKKELATYPWELRSMAESYSLHESTERTKILDRICASTQFGKRSQNRSRLKQVLEELLTNSIFHSYKDSNSSDKYDRLLPAQLSDEEAVIVRYAEQSSGLYISVEDRGGSLRLDHFTSCFKRCYSTASLKVTLEEKHQGAGIGLYLIFELASHMYICVAEGKQTSFALWLPQSGQVDPDNFSFNFFER